MGLIQEKFQVRAPDPHNEEQRNWVSSESARRKKPSADQEVEGSGIRGRKLNQLPPGDNIEAGFGMSQYEPKRVGIFADASDETRVWSEENAKRGYKRFDVKPTDDAYTGEHRKTFYGEVTVDGDTGFCERQNTLDRL